MSETDSSTTTDSSYESTTTDSSYEDSTREFTSVIKKNDSDVEDLEKHLSNIKVDIKRIEMGFCLVVFKCSFCIVLLILCYVMLLVKVERSIISGKSEVFFASFVIHFTSFLGVGIKYVQYLASQSSSFVCGYESSLKDEVKNNMNPFYFICVNSFDYNHMFKTRYINQYGVEMTRLDYNDNLNQFLFINDLENKTERWYYDIYLKNDFSKPYVSKFSLNVEHGEITIPYKPAIRVLMAVYCSGVKNGFVIASITISEQLEELLEKYSSINRVLIFSHIGTFIYNSVDRKWEWDKQKARENELLPLLPKSMNENKTIDHISKGFETFYFTIIKNDEETLYILLGFNRTKIWFEDNFVLTVLFMIVFLLLMSAIIVLCCCYPVNTKFGSFVQLSQLYFKKKIRIKQVETKKEI